VLAGVPPASEVGARTGGQGVRWTLRAAHLRPRGPAARGAGRTVRSRRSGPGRTASSGV
jgi:hypothetical protein